MSARTTLRLTSCLVSIALPKSVSSSSHACFLAFRSCCAFPLQSSVYLMTVPSMSGRSVARCTNYTPESEQLNFLSPLSFID